ncbi:MAG TPA: hypothetical protein VF885_01780 [Arthrobacter sp.]
MTASTPDIRLKAAVRADTLAQFDTDEDRVAAVLAAADKADASKGILRVTEDSAFDDLWGRQYPTGRGQWVYLDANAARAMAKRVITGAQERGAR